MSKKHGSKKNNNKHPHPRSQDARSQYTPPPKERVFTRLTKRGRR